MFYGINGAFKRYEGGNCAYVYDANEGRAFPLDTCFVDYYATDDTNPYHARMYSTIKEGTGDDETTRIERNTYYSQNCLGNANEHTYLDNDNLIYNNPDSSNSSNSSNSSDCYLEYIEYSSCSGWNTSVSISYKTKYIIVGACNNNQYSRCDNQSVSYVIFNDDTCCDLSYSYTGSNGPLWRLYDNIAPGCNQDSDTYIHPQSWMCQMPENADSVDVYSDNTDPECKDNALPYNIILSYISIFISIIIVFSI